MSRRSGSRIPHDEREGVRLDLYIDTLLASDLDAEAAKRGVMRAEAVRMALRAWLGRPESWGADFKKRFREMQRSLAAPAPRKPRK